MSSSQNLSSFDKSSLPDASWMKIGIVTAEWNKEITGKLYEGACSALKECGVKEENIVHAQVPGSFELPAGARLMANHHAVDAVICLGCIIQGETRHFEFICQAVAQGLTNLSVLLSKPFVFGVLTTDNHKQAIERAGGKFGNKGIEAAVTAIKMADLNEKLKKRKPVGF